MFCMFVYVCILLGVYAHPAFPVHVYAHPARPVHVYACPACPMCVCVHILCICMHVLCVCMCVIDTLFMNGFHILIMNEFGERTR